MRRDLEKFFIKVQLDYNSIKKQKEKIDDEYGKGLLDNNQYSNFLTYYNAVKVNYDRVHFMMYLLRKPPLFIERIIEKLSLYDIKSELKKYKELNADDEAVIKENKDAIDKINEKFNTGGDE